MFIYCIGNTATNKVYVGQTIQELNRRWIEHKRDLRGGRHHNSYLQNSWVKYGEDVWQFYGVAEATSMDELNHLEQLYIKLFNALAPKGYNLQGGGGNGKHSKLSKRKIAASLIGKRHSVASRQKRAKTRRPKGYPIIVSPDGIEHDVQDLTSFCREHNLHSTSMFAVVNRRRRAHRGWHVKGADMNISQFDLIAHRHRPQGYPALRSPTGEIFGDIRNMSAFCQEYGLYRSNMTWVLSKPGRSHKGWTLAPE